MELGIWSFAQACMVSDAKSVFSLCYTIYMQIKYLGWQSFVIRSRDGAVVTQPFSDHGGKRFPKLKADVVLSSSPVPSAIRERISDSEKQRQTLFFDGPGEYEVKGMEIWGVPGGFWLLSEQRKVFWLFSDKLTKSVRPLPLMQPDILLLGLKKPGKGWAEHYKQLLDDLSPAIIIPFSRDELSAKEMAGQEWSKPILDLLDMELLKSEADFSLKIGEELSQERRLVLLKPRFS